jgi:hypothetical protein
MDVNQNIFAPLLSNVRGSITLKAQFSSPSAKLAFSA